MMQQKIALEEHVSTPLNDSLWDSTGEAARNGKDYMRETEQRLTETSQRLAEMDRCGIEIAILSLTSPGAQALTDREQAIDFARQTNDFLVEHCLSVAPHRFKAFATVALQSPKVAADELERAVTQLGMCGALVNGFTNTDSSGTIQYLDEEPVWEFWDRVAALRVPVYLHPREPFCTQRRIYDDYPSLVGSAWGFGIETSTHAIRLMLSGLFDRYPELIVILGHLGEGLPYLLPRLEHRLYMQRNGDGLGKAKASVSEYLTRNFYFTTSGHFHTNALLNAISEIGADHVMFSVDYPYESMSAASEWFDQAILSETDQLKVGRTNAKQLFQI
jgi:gamma-resorcylate decarboxylase